MADRMTFPNTVEEFMEKYKIVDTYCVYTNGVEMVPIFRMQQWFDHVWQWRNNVPGSTWHDAQSADAINKLKREREFRMEEGDLEGVEAMDIALRALVKEDMWRELAASYERTIVKLTEAIAEQAQNAGAKMT